MRSASRKCQSQLTYRPDRFRDWIVGHCIDQTTQQRIARMKLFRRQKHLHCSALADETRQPLRAAPSGDEAKRRASMSEYCVRLGDAPTTGESEIQPSAHAIAVNSGEGWGRETGDGIHKPLAHVGEAKGLGAVQLSDFVKVSAGGEEMEVAGNDQPRRSILRELLYCCG